MPPRAFALCLTAASPMIVSAHASPQLDGTRWAQLTLRERVVIRIPRVSAQATRPQGTERSGKPVEWEEKKAPKCIATQHLAGAAVTRDGDVDLILNNGGRLRAKLDDDCPTLAFYAGFYLKPATDGMICADRDALRSRSGARCEIARFRTLVPKR